MSGERDLIRDFSWHLKQLGKDSPILELEPNDIFPIASDLSSVPESVFALEGIEQHSQSETEADITSELAVDISGAWNILRKEVMSCTKCRLCSGRTNVVFGDGNNLCPPIAFVGEGPGAEEDAQGLPFVGRSGELLTKAIVNGIGIPREQVFICNVVKCRPPDNRAPLPDESATCLPYLERQLRLAQPRVIVTLGSVALKALHGESRGGITALRGKWLEWNGFKLLPTFHPAYLLRNPSAKRLFWEDLKQVMSFLGLQLSSSSRTV